MAGSMHSFRPRSPRAAEHIGAQKIRVDATTLLTLAVLAGAFIALGAMFATTVLAGADGIVPYGISRLLAGIVFCLGLILVIVGGAELFTGNTLMVMAWAAGKSEAHRDAAGLGDHLRWQLPWRDRNSSVGVSLGSALER